MRFIFTVSTIAIVLVFLSFVMIPTGKKSTLGESSNNSNGIKNELPTGFNDLFAGSGECAMCHSDMVNTQGDSIGIVDDWRSSMKANAARDPFWRAKVSHEGLVNPGHAEVLEDVCIKCHAPMGHFNAHHNGQQLYLIEEMENDPLAMDGVSCTVCHQITEESFGNYSGNLIIGTEKKIWGPFEEPFTGPMFNHTGYTPTYSPHIKDSKLCGSCHTLITNTVDLNGVPTGSEFVEQAVYHEWLNSDFPEMDVSCQTCHVPEINDSVIISSMPFWYEVKRSPFGLHHLAGANVFMLRLLKGNIEELGLTASEIQFDSTIARATRMLKENTLNLHLTEVLRTNDTLFVDITMENKAGHKFPSGYPSRRAFVELFVINATNDTVFHSGEMDDNYNLVNEEPGFESHYNMINDELQVQIYEMVMGNVDLEPTTILERAYVQLKDNRIPPSGFTTTHPSYDTIQIVGNALTDEDFNVSGGVQGTGKDIVHYHIPLNNEGGELIVHAVVHYQTVNDKWLENMFTYSSDEIDAFKDYYNDADKEPVKVGEASLVSTITDIKTSPGKSLNIYPNPAKDYIYLEFHEDISEVGFYRLNGSSVMKSSFNYKTESENLLVINTPPESGIYIFEVKTTKGQFFTEKIVVYK